MTTTTSNHLIASFGPAVAAATVGAGRRRMFRSGDLVWTAGEPEPQACFPERGLFALQMADPNGTVAEIAAAGREGALGLADAMAGRPSPYDCRALTDGAALMLSANTVMTLCRSSSTGGAIHTHAAEAASRLASALFCAMQHEAPARLADCLLQYAAQLESARVPLTQDTLAATTGVCRTTISQIMQTMIARGLIETGRGRAAILDPAGLAALACGCRSRWPTACARAEAQDERGRLANREPARGFAR